MSAHPWLADDSARRRLLRGVEALAEVVGATLGPRGGAVMLANGGRPRLSRDGVDVALAVQLSDRLANLGAELVRSTVAESCAPLGDGTSTAIVLARAMARRAVELRAAGFDESSLERGMQSAVARVCAELAARARPMGGSHVARVAELSAGGDEAAGELLARAFEAVGATGLIELEVAPGTASGLELELGAKFSRGYLSPHFVEADRNECVFEEARILLVHTAIWEIEPLVPLLEAALAAQAPLLIVAEDVLGDALGALVVNRLRTGLKVVAVRTPGFGLERREHLKDLAVLTGTRVVGDESGGKLGRTTLDELGRARRVVVDAKATALIGAAGDPAAVRGRSQELTRRLDQFANDDARRAAASARLRQLADGAAIIRVGGHSETEARDRKERYEDAVAAVRAAFEGGLVEGGGVALLRCEGALREASGDAGERAGQSIVARTLSEPVRQLARNAGCDAEDVVTRLRATSPCHGFDAARGEIVDFEAAQMWDPRAVVEQGLVAAARVARLVMSCGACLIGSEAPFDDFADV